MFAYEVSYLSWRKINWAWWIDYSNTVFGITQAYARDHTNLYKGNWNKNFPKNFDFHIFLKFHQFIQPKDIFEKFLKIFLKILKYFKKYCKEILQEIGEISPQGFFGLLFKIELKKWEFLQCSERVITAPFFTFLKLIQKYCKFWCSLVYYNIYLKQGLETENLLILTPKWGAELCGASFSL